MSFISADFNLYVNRITTRRRYSSEDISTITTSSNTMTGGTSNSCPKCGRTYTRKTNLLRHMRIECGKEAQFQCSQCFYKCKHKHSMLRHLTHKHNTIDNNGV